MLKQNKGSSEVCRIILWAGNIFGHYLLFAPILTIILYIPLFGWLFAKFLSIAFFIFSLIWGSMIHLIIMSIAWIFYRPILGIIFGSISAVLVLLVFFVS